MKNDNKSFMEEQNIASIILATARRVKISNDKLDIIGIHGWADVFKKIEAKFIVKENSSIKFNWWWENLKGDSFSIAFRDDGGYKYLDRLVAPNEKIWFIVCDISRDPTKFWLFDGFIEPIQQVISEFYAFEYYIVSKTYDWFLCENHHRCLIGLGTVKDKMIVLQESLNSIGTTI